MGNLSACGYLVETSRVAGKYSDIVEIDRQSSESENAMQPVVKKLKKKQMEFGVHTVNLEN